MLQITLRYSRNEELVEDEHLMTGQLELLLEEGQEPVRETFYDLSFFDMMGRLSEAAQQYPEAALYLARKESNAPPHLLLEPSAALLREDVQAYVDAVTIRPKVIRVIRGEGAKQAPIPAGSETVADTFGDRVFFRLRPGAFESPTTGRWCSDADLPSWAQRFNEDWASAGVDALLEEPHSRFYFPRRWNPSQGWIVREELERMLTNYRKEKESCR